MVANELFILSGGAAAGVVRGVQEKFSAQHQCVINATFSAVGVMRDKLLSGAACDLVILTKSLIHELIISGHVMANSLQSMGLVRTGIAVKSNTTPPAISNKNELYIALDQARSIYFPDPIKATAGKHIMNVFKTIGIDKSHTNRFRTYANGALAMSAMASSSEDDLIGCTQITEIMITTGTTYVGHLPPEFELITDYTLGISTHAKNPTLAAAFAAILTGRASQVVRKSIGFE